MQRLLLGFTLVLFCGLASAQDEPVEGAAGVQLTYRLPADVESVPAGTRLLVLQVGAPFSEPEIEIPLAGPTIAVPLSVGESRKVLLQSDDLWAPPVVLGAADPSGSSARTIPTWHVATITGRVRIGTDTAAPSAPILEARVTLAAGTTSGGERLRATSPCVVDDKGVFECRVPATAQDLRLDAGDRLVPEYRWDLEPRASKPLDLGLVTFREGSSLVGRVEATVGVLVPDRTEITVEPVAAPGGVTVAAGRLKETREIVTLRKDGFFQIRGLRPGLHVLEARHSGFAPTRVQVEIYPGREVRLQDPVQLHLPLSLHLQVEPALSPQDSPWHAEVLRRAVGSAQFEPEPVYLGTFVDDGTLEITGQSPGHYSVSIRDELGNVFWSEMDRAVTSEPDGFWHIDLDLISIEGDVRLAGEPIAARVWFGGRGDAMGSSFDADAEEGFVGTLPRAGTWKVEIASRESRLNTFVRVEVPEKGNPPRRVDLEIPDTLVTGSVVDAAGRPVAQARVLVESSGDSVGAVTNEKGEFEARGLPEGRIQLMAISLAHGERLTSSREETHVREHQPAGPVVLRLEDQEPVGGRVVSGIGPVPGALVLFLPTPGRGGFGVTARTDLEGRFEAELPRNLDRVHAVVLPPGHTLKAFEIDLSYGRNLVLQVPTEGGTLRIASPFDEESMLADNLGLRIETHGIALPKSQLHQWSFSHGGRFGWNEIIIPQAAPGHYRICLYSRAGDESGSQDGQRCTDGYLDANSELTLQLEADGASAEEG